MRKILILGFLLFVFQGCGPETNDSKKDSANVQVELIARAEFSSMKEKMVYPPFPTEVLEMVPEGSLVEPGQELAKLSPGSRLEMLLEESANLEKLSLQMNLEKMKKAIAEEIEEKKIAQAKLAMDKAKIELDRALSMRDWLRITELEESFKLDKIKLNLLKKQLDAARKMIGRGFVARQELLENEKELAVTEINASLTVKLTAYLLNNADEKQLARARQAYKNAVLDYELASFTMAKNLADHDYQYKQFKNDYDQLAEEVAKLENEIASLSVIAKDGGLVVYGSSHDGSALIKVRPGSMVYPGVNFLRLVEPHRGSVDLFVDPKDYALLNSTDRLYFRPDAFPEHLLTCRTNEKAKVAFEVSGGRPDGRTFVELKAEVGSYPEVLKLGYSGSVFLHNPKESLLPAFGGNRLYTVKRKNMARKTSNTGDIKPASSTYILGAFEGKVNSLAEEGKSVKAGETLAVIASEELDETARDMEIELEKKREELLLMDEKHRIDQERITRELEVKAGALEVAKLRHAALLKRREEDKIIDLQKSLEVIQSRIELAKEKVAHIKELHKKGLRSELQLLQAKQELAVALRDREITSYKLRLEEFGPTRRSVQISAIEMQKVGLEKEIAEKEAAQASLINSMSKQILEKEISKIEITLNRRQKQLEQAEIKAPEDGVVIFNETHISGKQAKVKVGDQINPQIPFMQIANMNNLQVHTQISEMDAKFIKPGDEVKVYMKGNSVTVAPGWVSSVALIADTNFIEAQEANVKIIVDLLSPARGVNKAPDGFRPGSSCEVEFSLYDAREALVVPYDAILPTAEGPAVVGEDLKIKLVEVDFSDGLEGFVIKSGISEGERLVLMEAGFD
jgi:multidrug efflux pump subunit AcrA (membrane-fusion protein)